MGVTAYEPRQRGNLQNPRPLPLMFSAEEKWWTDYASSEAGAESLSKSHIRNMLSALGCFRMTQEMAYALSELALH